MVKDGSSGTLIDLGNITLASGSTIQTTVASAAGADINIDQITGAGNTLTLDAGNSGAIQVAGTVDNATPCSKLVN